MRSEKIECLHKRETTTAIEKSFIQNRIKSRNIFLQASIKVSENSDIKHLLWSKTYPKKEKKTIRKDVVRISEAVVRMSSVIKNSLKILLLFICISSTWTLSSEQQSD